MNPNLYHDEKHDDIIAVLCHELLRERQEREHCVTALHLAYSHLSQEQIAAIEAAFKADHDVLHKTPREVITTLHHALAREKNEKQQFLTALHLALSHLPVHLIDAIEATLELIYGHGHDSADK